MMSPADMNCDGAVDGLDVDGFALALSKCNAILLA